MSTRVDVTGSLEDYLDFTDETSQRFRENTNDLYALLQETYAVFRDEIWASKSDAPIISLFLSMNAFMLFLASIRMTLTGHVAASFPIFRAGLESACYALLVKREPALGDVWVNRHDSADARKACRREFTDAVSKVAKQFEEAAEESGEWIREAYDLSIDFGAHPNIRGMREHLRTDKLEETGVVSFSGVYSHDHWQIDRTLLACAEYGLAIAVVTANVTDVDSETVQPALVRLNERREEIVQKLNAGANDLERDVAQ